MISEEIEKKDPIETRLNYLLTTNFGSNKLSYEIKEEDIGESSNNLICQSIILQMVILSITCKISRLEYVTMR